MKQTKVFDRAARSFDGTFTFDSIREKLHNDREWTKDDDYIGRCIIDRKNKVKIRELQNGLYEWIDTPVPVESHQEDQNNVAENASPKWRIEKIIRDIFVLVLMQPNKGYPKTLRSKPLNTRSIRDLDDIKTAAIEVYKKPAFGQTGIKHPKYSDEPAKTAINNLAEKVHSYFNNTEPNTSNNKDTFDVFHRDLCNSFKNDLGCGTYGNAQKMVNVLFKYLACYRDYDDFADLFSYCHIPIDNKILFIFKTIYGVDGLQGSNANSMKYSNKTWSRFEYEDYKSLLDEYRDKLENNKYRDYRIGNHPWLVIDFYFWGITLPQPTKETNKPPIPVEPIERFYSTPIIE